MVVRDGVKKKEKWEIWRIQSNANHKHCATKDSLFVHLAFWKFSLDKKEYQTLYLVASDIRITLHSTIKYHYFLKVFNALLHAITWSSIKLTLLRCNSAGLNVVKFSKSVNKDNVG